MNNHKTQITERDLERIFANKKPKPIIIGKVFAKYFGFVILIFAIIFVVINYRAFSDQAKYWYQNDIKINDNNQTNSIITEKPQTESQPEMPNNHLLISRIKVNAPITFNVPNEDVAVAKALETGAIHLKGTALPGTVGNVFVTAHSSNYFWSKGEYNTLFATLGQLVVGDLIYIKYSSKTYKYTVYKSFVTNPNDLSVLNQGNESILTLMTCSPVGTNLKRLIVIAKQTYPNPNTNIASNKSNTNNALPKTR